MEEKPKRARFSLQLVLLMVTYAGLGLALLKPWEPPPLPSPSVLNYDQIEPGMTLAQVERLLGPTQGLESVASGTTHFWTGPMCMIVEVLIGSDGKVETVSVH
jgi:hypothetical protein